MNKSSKIDFCPVFGGRHGRRQTIDQLELSSAFLSESTGLPWQLVTNLKKTTISFCRCRSRQKGWQVGCFFNMNRLGFLFSVLLLLDPPSFCLQSVLWIETFSAGCWKPKLFLSFRLMWGLRNRLPLKDTKSPVTWIRVVQDQRLDKNLKCPYLALAF